MIRVELGGESFRGKSIEVATTTIVAHRYRAVVFHDDTTNGDVYRRFIRTRGCRFHFYTHVRAFTFGRTRVTPGGRRRKRACQLPGNVVHDWITRGCIAIVLRLLVRHGVGGRGWRQHLQTSIQRYPPASIFSFSHSFSLYSPSFFYLFPDSIFRLPRKDCRTKETRAPN